MRYANEATVYRLLAIDPDTEDPDILLDIQNVEEGVAATIDAKCSRTFGSAPVQKTRTIDVRVPQFPGYTGPRYADRVYIGDGLYFFFNYAITDSDTVFSLHTGVKNVTSVVYGGTWDGTVWVDEVVPTADAWRSVFVDRQGWAHGIAISAPATSLRVTAEWEDESSSSTVPPEIREAATFITVDEYRIRMQSPAGEIGPPGLGTFLRNAWEFELVKTAIDKNTFRQIVA